MPTPDPKQQPLSEEKIAELLKRCERYGVLNESDTSRVRRALAELVELRRERSELQSVNADLLAACEAAIETLRLTAPATNRQAQMIDESIDQLRTAIDKAKGAGRCSIST